MNRTFQIGDATVSLELTPDAGRPGSFRARFADGTVMDVTLSPSGGPPRTIRAGGRSHALSIARARDRTWVQIGSCAFECEPVRASRGPARAGPGRDPEVRSPIAGKVLRVFVEIGATVAAGQKLLSVEAMKMENDIHASIAGRVARLAVAPGHPIQPGDLLVVVEPAEPSGATGR
jgi:pyruvate carboxylase subunit B